MKVEKFVSHIRFFERDENIYSKEKLYEKLNIELGNNIFLRIGEILTIDGNKYKITDIQFIFSHNEWAFDYLKDNKTMNIVEEEEDFSKTNSEILIYIDLIK